jgi:hypothetical protein
MALGAAPNSGGNASDGIPRINVQLVVVRRGCVGKV